MSELLLSLGLWVGISVVAVLMFVLGVAIGRRGAWEEGYRFGLHVGEAQARRRMPPDDEERRAG